MRSMSEYTLASATLAERGPEALGQIQKRQLRQAEQGYRGFCCFPLKIDPLFRGILTHPVEQ
jgi:hypothetical protein